MALLLESITYSSADLSMHTPEGEVNPAWVPMPSAVPAAEPLAPPPASVVTASEAKSTRRTLWEPEAGT
jgi:hypothetical protein